MAEIVKKISITETLKSMRRGEVMRIEQTDMKPGCVGSAANRLKKEGYNIRCSEGLNLSNQYTVMFIYSLRRITLFKSIP